MLCAMPYGWVAFHRTEVEGAAGELKESARRFGRVPEADGELPCWQLLLRQLLWVG